MGTMGETPTLDDQVRRRIEPIPGIAVLVVFGSRARGDHRPGSDLDVAVLPEMPEPRARWRLQTGVAAALADLAPEGRVDVVFLDEVPVTLRQSVMEHGRVLINRDPEAWKELRVRTMREYGDSEWARELYRKPEKRRLDALEGYLLELRSFRSVSREEFLKKPSIHHLAERYLHLACESVLNGAVLHEEGLEPGLAEQMKSWVGLRNVLAHRYLEIDHGRVYEAIQHDLGDLEKFAAAMSRFL